MTSERTDLEAWASGAPYPPAICGHEWAGTVAKLPADVRTLREGDRVALGIAPARGACHPCRAGDPARCGTVSLVGLAAKPAEIHPGAWLAQELRLVASLGYERGEFDLVQALLSEGRVVSEALVSSRAPLEQLPAVFERLPAQPDEIKVLVDPRV